MKSCFGDAINISLFGESHSAAIGVVINGLAAGIELDTEFIKAQMDKRRAVGKISTKRHEPDEIVFLSGFFNGRTTGTPLCMMIENTSQKSGDYEKTKNLLRPSHADFTANEKYRGFEDYRGGGHFSGRLTAPIVAAGAVALQILNAHGIKIATHIKKLGKISDSDFSQSCDKAVEQSDSLNSDRFPVINEEIGNKMIQLIEKTAAEGDSVGGILETIVLNMPIGIGEPFFNSIESKLSQLLFSIPAVKGVEFGAGFGFSDFCGSQGNDEFLMENGKIATKTNNNGGINGGISNGMPILIKTAIKPTPSIYKSQQTVDISKMQNAELKIEGRHDPAIIHRARVVADSMVALGLLDLFCERYGYLWSRV